MTKTNTVATLPIELADLNVVASATAAGIVELATTAEATTGTDTARAVTPAGLAAAATTHVAAASTTVAGKVELATNAETITGTDTDRAVTPAGLAAAATTHVAAASDTVAGKVELATGAEAKTGSDTARAVTPAGLRSVLSGLKFISFDGRNGAGVCTAVGAGVGDLVLYVAGLTEGALGNASASFESAITVVQEIQQSAGADLSLNNYLVVLLAVT
jgi:hypothetical protein